MKVMKGWIIFVAVTVFFGIGISSGQASSDYPNHPIEYVVPYAPGAGTDIVSRAYKEYLEKVLGQPIIQIFKTGAGGAIGTAFVANAKPDGYTFIVATNSPMVLAPLLKKPGYTLDDFTPVCSLSYLPLCWVVRDDSPFKTIKDFINAAKTKKMICTTYGNLTAGHIYMEALGRAAGFQTTYVPYDGASKAYTAVLGGHGDISVAAGSFGLVGPGRLRFLAVAYKERFELLPDVPTLKEMGYPIIGNIYYSLWGPKGLSKEIVNKLYEAHKRVVKENGKEISKIINRIENVMDVLGPEEILAEYQADYKFQKKMLEEMGQLHK